MVIGFALLVGWTILLYSASNYLNGRGGGSGGGF